MPQLSFREMIRAYCTKSIRCIGNYMLRSFSLSLSFSPLPTPLSHPFSFLSLFLFSPFLCLTLPFLLLFIVLYSFSFPRFHSSSFSSIPYSLSLFLFSSLFSYSLLTPLSLFFLHPSSSPSLFHLTSPSHPLSSSPISLSLPHIFPPYLCLSHLFSFVLSLFLSHGRNLDARNANSFSVTNEHDR